MRRQQSFKGGWLSVSVCVYVLQYITYVHLKKNATQVESEPACFRVTL